MSREITVYRFNPDAREILPRIILKVCSAIDNQYGRLTPFVFEHDEYQKNRMGCLQKLINEQHLVEKSGSTFLHLVDRKEIDQWIETRKVSHCQFRTTET